MSMEFFKFLFLFLLELNSIKS